MTNRPAIDRSTTELQRQTRNRKPSAAYIGTYSHDFAFGFYIQFLVNVCTYRNIYIECASCTKEKPRAAAARLRSEMEACVEANRKNGPF